MMRELQSGKSVAITGLGKFTPQYQSSSFDPVANSYLPPGIKIQFTENETEVDNGFEFILAKYYQISNSEAKEIIAENVASIKERLKVSDTANIELFGTFSGKPGFVVFKAEVGSQQNMHSFGLTPVRCKNQPIVTKKITIEKTDSKDREENADELRLKSLQELKKLLENAQLEQNENAKAKSSRLFPVIATVLTLVLLINVVILLYKNPFSVQQHEQVATMDMGGQLLNNKTKETAITNQKTEVKQKDKSTDYTFNIKNLAAFYTQRDTFSTTLFEELVTENQSVEPETINNNEQLSEDLVNALPVLRQNAAIGSNKISTKTKKDAKVMVARAAVNNIDVGFYVIAGVFSIEENANKYKQELKTLGYIYANTMKPLKFRHHMVYFQKFSNREDALESIEVFSKVNEDAWIYEAR
jgi:nucleoid DNA-binding protein